MTKRRLVLIRHSKTAAGSPDIDRALSDQGLRDAAAVGRWLTELELTPDRVVVSTALRAQQTWETAAAHHVSAPRPVIDERIYDNTVEDLLAVIRSTPATASTLILVGHNPSMGEFANVLDDDAGDRTARAEIARSYPTSGVCVFDVAVEWPVVDAGDGTVTSFTAPRG
jgi:phosphohistidine phosphatase